MLTVSLCMIVKNEEPNLTKCLESVKDLVDEIIIVDTGSTDRTKEEAKKYSNQIYDFIWIDDFAAARNFAFSKATQDYLLWLDADDLLLEDDRIKFKKLKEQLDPEVDVVMMPYHAGFDKDGNVILTYLRERLLKRSKNFKWVEPVHECIQPSGYILISDVIITHRKSHSLSNSGRNLKIYRHLEESGQNLSPRALLYYGMELYFNQFYSEATMKFGRFLETGQGWIEDNLKACYYLGKSYYCLNDPDNALKTYLKSYEYDLPRAEHTCEIAYIFKNRRDYQRAIFWFELAYKLKQPEHSWGFFFSDYWGYIPCIELSICYYFLKDLERAVAYNEKAAAFKPQNSAVLHNRQFYENNQNVIK